MYVSLLSENLLELAAFELFLPYLNRGFKDGGGRSACRL